MIAAGDFSGDGDADLVFRNSVTGWSETASKPYAYAAGNSLRLIDPLGLFGYGASIVKNRLMWRNTSTGAVAIWEMNGSSIAASQTLTPPSGTPTSSCSRSPGTTMATAMATSSGATRTVIS